MRKMTPNTSLLLSMTALLAGCNGLFGDDNVDDQFTGYSGAAGASAGKGGAGGKAGTSGVGGACGKGGRLGLRKTCTYRRKRVTRAG